ncbi:hypothetical protein OROHE_018788 [Orobanche hederae]
MGSSESDLFLFLMEWPCEPCREYIRDQENQIFRVRDLCGTGDPVYQKSSQTLKRLVFGAMKAVALCHKRGITCGSMDGLKLALPRICYFDLDAISTSTQEYDVKKFGVLLSQLAYGSQRLDLDKVEIGDDMGRIVRLSQSATSMNQLLQDPYFLNNNTRMVEDRKIHFEDALASEFISSDGGILNHGMLTKIVQASLENLNKLHQEAGYTGNNVLNPNSILLRNYFAQKEIEQSDVEFIRSEPLKDWMSADHEIRKRKDVRLLANVIRCLRYGTAVEEFDVIDRLQVPAGYEAFDNVPELSSLLSYSSNGPNLKDVKLCDDLILFFKRQKPSHVGPQYPPRLLVRRTLPVVDGDGLDVYVSQDGGEPLPDKVIARFEAGERAFFENQIWYRKIYYNGTHVLARKYKIRLRGVDAPETYKYYETPDAYITQDYGKEATIELRNLVLGKELRIDIIDNYIDPHGRHVADVYCNNIFVQEYLLTRGCAWHFDLYDDRNQLKEWHEEAMEARAGLWGQPTDFQDVPMAPWDFRNRYPPPFRPPG